MNITTPEKAKASRLLWASRAASCLRISIFHKEGSCTIRMAKGLIWATTEDLARNRAKVLSLYRQILRSLNSPELPLTHVARLAKKAEVRSIFLFGAEERSLHNIADLIDAANYSLSILKQGRLP
ncbi:hypothetical protein OPV22_028768 [Ensete ventricosum]|uniref:LYR motif containing domain-containing protein n=1 Tax=Ensete ventricosum TaxID=4639 RepID=A0AAV8P5E4_ENSVE|nr:hypothetical protein OPV22_028768 [Ensete ventricosum]